MHTGHDLTSHKRDCVSCSSSPPPCVCASGTACIQISQSCSACASFTCVTSGLQPVFPETTVAPGVQLPGAMSTLSVDDSTSKPHQNEGAIIGGSVGGGLAFLAVLLAMIAYGLVLRRRKMRGRPAYRHSRHNGHYEEDDSIAPALMRESNGEYF